ncbi:MAG: hypothetical protein F6K31_39670 [Symploca sp. SIO2G7]|nr:hypothetical protein [Symploca sp. SIO2G7]
MHFVNPHIWSLSTLQHPIYGKTQGEKKNGDSSSRCFPNSPNSLSPRHRVPASGASLDNDTFTLTLTNSQFPIPHSQFPTP